MRFFSHAERDHFKPTLSASLWMVNLTCVLNCFNLLSLGDWDTPKPKCCVDPLVPRNEDLSDGNNLVINVG